MPLECPHCGQNSIEEDGQYIQDYLICCSCGAVIEEGKLTDTTQGTVYAIKDRNVVFKSHPGIRLGCRSISQGQKQGLEAISILSSKLNVPSTYAQEAKELFKRTLQVPHMKGVPVPKKVSMAGCCIYVVLRQAELPISIVSMCRCCGCSIDEFSAGYSLLVRAANLKIKQPPVDEIVESLLSEVDFGEEKAAVVKRTTEIVRLASLLWLATSRTNEPLVLACSFVAWKSLSCGRATLSYEGFCRETKANKSRPVVKRVKEVIGMLTELGKKLPWLKEKDLIAASVSLHVADILKYSNALRLADHMGGQKRSLEDLDEVEFKKFRCMDRPRSKCNPSTSTEPINEEITDDDINQYIRSEQEVQFIRKLYKKYGDNS